ncbi:regulatory protein ICP22 [Cercopithecine alphaherpesvirus 2]|uniref:Immediate early protein ICP22 n=1 Tax=Cercopithecine alphaherpesvirus 2 TaxID=10317 RepID=Q5Y0P2_9ALPH|nr:regulatory protein ICP22 [Cercopithecine alphaherpesvirus 2]AAU88126.1 immediate early protein ICP22 [Cercopithecine alphaherpesvirus 2]
MPTDTSAFASASANPSPPPSPVLNGSRRRCFRLPSLSDSDSEGSSGAVVLGGGEAGLESGGATDQRSRVRGGLRVAGGMYFIDDEAEEASELESEPETDTDFESVSEADLESVSEVTSGLGSDSDSDSDGSADEPRAGRPQPIRINIRLVSSPDRRAGVVFPESRGTRSSPGTEPPPSERPDGSERRATRASEGHHPDEWSPDLPYLRRSINGMFRLLRRGINPRGAADRLRRLVRDCYLLGYTRHRLEPGMWPRMLQVGGGQAARLRNVIENVVLRAGDAGEILPMPPSPREHHGVACDRSDASDAASDDDSRLGPGDDDTPDDSDATLESASDDERAAAPPGAASGGPPEENAPGSVASRLRREFVAFDWTPEEGSQPWLSSVVADTSSAERRRGDSPGPCRERETGGCRRMRFSTTCPYPCGRTFLRM